uniref:Uncharacterized protein n=1 Tax=Anguilla anguilla TaxID=7936 RepID=A0A0E9Q6K5_ANGAN
MPSVKKTTIGIICTWCRCPP